jgi:hypothetical protein
LPLKVHNLQPGLNLQILGPMASMQPLDHQGRRVLIIMINSQSAVKIVTATHT